MGMLLERLQLYFFRMKWRRFNVHNNSVALNCFNSNLVTVGRGTYGGIYVRTFNKENKLKIGCYCSIGPNVRFLLSADHYINHLSTFPFKAKIVSGELEGISKGDIIVSDDVWIGENAVILSGVTVHQGAVISAGAVVTKDVPPYAVAGGVPAKVIKYRFEDEIIRELLKLDYERFTKEHVKQHLGDLYTEIQSVEQVQEMEWFPRKKV